MSDEQTPSDEPTAVETTAEQPAASPTDGGTAPTSVKDRWASQLSTRDGLAASGVGLVVISGLGGFALGHATAGDGDDARFVRFDRFSEDGSGHRPGPGGMPPEGVPGGPDGPGRGGPPDRGGQQGDTDRSS